RALGAGLRTPGVLNNLAHAYLMKHRPVEALALLDEALRLNPDSVPARLNRLQCFCRLADKQRDESASPVPQEALEEVEKVVRLVGEEKLDETGALYFL